MDTVTEPTKVSKNRHWPTIDTVLVFRVLVGQRHPPLANEQRLSHQGPTIVLTRLYMTLSSAFRYFTVVGLTLNSASSFEKWHKVLLENPWSWSRWLLVNSFALMRTSTRFGSRMKFRVFTPVAAIWPPFVSFVFRCLFFPFASPLSSKSTAWTRIFLALCLALMFTPQICRNRFPAGCVYYCYQR